MRFPKNELLKQRRTKIVATLGPSSATPRGVEDLIQAGANVFRLNMSHGSHEDHRRAYEHVRTAAAKLGQPTAVLVDLSGPKMRVGHFADGRIELPQNHCVTVTTRDVIGNSTLIPSQFAGLADAAHPGDHIMLDDGMIELEVTDVQGSELTCTVVHGGLLKDHKGLNLPGGDISAPALTDKDRIDARFALDLGADFLALSFVRDAEDIHQLKEIIAGSGSDAHVIAKIERPEAMDVIDEILDAADGLMVARGDLGVELPPELVPVAQRQLLASAREKNKPAIVATQMLESMIDHPRPTRAELSDVASAVFSGADAIMLSAETASGAYPSKSVEIMDRVARQAEACLWTEGAFGGVADVPSSASPSVDRAIARALGQLSRDLRARTIVVQSATGTTASVVSAARPAAPIVALTPEERVCRRMSLLWGVVPVVMQRGEELRDSAPRVARELGLADEGHCVLALAGLERDDESSRPAMHVLRA